VRLDRAISLDIYAALQQKYGVKRESELDKIGVHILDAVDFRILRELTADGRISDVSLADRVHLSSTAVARRRKVLEEQGVISGYSVNLDIGLLGYSVIVVVHIELNSQTEQVLNEFEAMVSQCPSVSYCSFISGDTDFLMIVHVRSFDDYDRVYRQELSKLPHVSRIRSSFVMRRVGNHTVPPVVFTSNP